MTVHVDTMENRSLSCCRKYVPRSSRGEVTVSVFTNPAAGAEGSAQTYIDSTLALLGDDDPLTILRRGPSAFEELMNESSPEDLRRPEAPGKWSAAALAQHMADSETIWAYRLRMALAHDRPTLAGYDQDAWAKRLRYTNADPAEALTRFGIMRRANLALLESLISEEWDRVSVHSERGEESVKHMARLYAGHDLVHRRQMARILA
jgi:hypothetical protein